MFICPDGPRNASKNGFEKEIINRRFFVFHQNVRPTSYTGLSTNNGFNLLTSITQYSGLNKWIATKSKIAFSILTLSLLMTIKETFVDSVDQDQTEQKIQSDL